MFRVGEYANLRIMLDSPTLAATNKDKTASLPDSVELPAAYIALQQQLEQQSELVDKKSQVIQNQQARIDVLEELLRSKQVERFAASSEVNPLQARLFNDVEAALDEDAASESIDDQQPSKADEKAQKKPRPKRKGLNPDIPRVQHRLLLSDEQRENALDTFFVTVKEELDITPAQVQVIEILQEKAVYLDEGGERRVVAATREPHPLGKSVASVALLAYLIIAKYCVMACRSTVLRVFSSAMVVPSIAPRWPVG